MSIKWPGSVMALRRP